MEQNKRHTGLDLMRICAFFFVAGVHFFLNSGFYEQIVAGPRMYIMVVLRNLFMICIPLFMVMSGMVLGDRKPGLSYYLGIIKVIFIYVLASICCGVYRAVFLDQPISPVQMISGILSYWVADYGWYIEMYLGLFLLIPFLNIAYDALKTKKGKQILLLVMLVLTAVPGVVNIWRVDGLDWWLRPSSVQIYHQIIPEFWIDLYPLTFFFIGRYLREYPLKLSRPVNLLLILAVTLFNGSFNYYRSFGNIFVWGGWQTWGALPNVALAALVANFFNGLTCEKLPQKAKSALAMVSNWALGAYLVSWIFDSVLYRMLSNHVAVMHYRLEWFPVIVLAVAICSLALSAVLYGIYSLTGAKLIEWLRKKLCK